MARAQSSRTFGTAGSDEKLHRAKTLGLDVGINYHTQDFAEVVERETGGRGVDVLLDDRDERPGVMFADMELTGIPHRVVIGERGLKQNQLEYQGRRDKAAQPVALDGAGDLLLHDGHAGQLPMEPRAGQSFTHLRAHLLQNCKELRAAVGADAEILG